MARPFLLGELYSDHKLWCGRTYIFTELREHIDFSKNWKQLLPTILQKLGVITVIYGTAANQHIILQKCLRDGASVFQLSDGEAHHLTKKLL